ncbi:PKD domain-containing protein [Agromyces allii]|uniref:PKD domain-containing protein n=1 Tax=Agromyces allii TaxID=393607 RepID=A0ABN2Q059_9MICO|nr:hypothetical protein [Agromyces allii]
MVRGRFLLTTGVALLLTATLVSAPTAAVACPISEIIAGGCGTDSGAEVGEGKADLWAIDHSSAPGAGSGDSKAGDATETIDEIGNFEKPVRIPDPWTEVCQAGHVECVDVPVPTGPPVAQAPGVAPTVVTLRDIASFRPAVPGNDMEPGGWAVTGLPANFVAAASAQIVTGTLLGQPADVRFTPVGYRWTHSDGGSVTSAGPGATWAELGKREFTPTDTSHVYVASGEYTVTLEVALEAEYRFAGSGWLPIAGTLSVASDPRTVVVGEIDTVLTRGDCLASPRDPGC